MVLKLNLGGNEEFDGGGNTTRLDDFIHVDARKQDRVGLVADVRCGLPVEWVGQVEEIRASHVIEHMIYDDALTAVRYWATFLVHGGLMRLYCPDASKLAVAYLQKNITMADFSRMVFGEQDYELNLHRAAYDQARLNELVTAAGLTIVSTKPRPKAYPYDLGVQAIKA